MVEDKLKGYRGVLRELLRRAGAEIGDEIELRYNNKHIRGILLPRSELEDEWHIVLKLSNGYNVGIRYRKDLSIKIIEKKKAVLTAVKRRSLKIREDLPRVHILGVGGTIASRVDYTTGAVRSVYTPEELAEMFPELIDIASIKTKIIMNKYSEHLKADDWKRIAEEVANSINEDVNGVIIMHGTDTMHYTSAALSFALQDLPVPVILVGSQRSSDRPSSDAALNLISAVYFASYGPIAEVMIAMHESTSDNSVVLHKGNSCKEESY